VQVVGAFAASGLGEQLALVVVRRSTESEVLPLLDAYVELPV
jgi:hypothetical protein